MEDFSDKVMRFGGGWGNVGGPGLLVITSGFIASVFVGMTGASAAALLYDTATVPFVVSACAGFTFGVIGFYRDALRKALRSLDRYPRLLQLHLDANFSHRGFENWTLRQLHSSNFRTWQMQSMLVAAWMTASPALERIKEGREEALVAQQIEDKQGESEVKMSREWDGLEPAVDEHSS